MFIIKKVVKDLIGLNERKRWLGAILHNEKYIDDTNNFLVFDAKYYREEIEKHYSPTVDECICGTDKPRDGEIVILEWREINDSPKAVQIFNEDPDRYHEIIGGYFDVAQVVIDAIDYFRRCGDE